MRGLIFLSVILCTLISVSLAAGENGSYQELGKVHWYRSFDEAIALSEEKDKPVFILFQEVPGCATCVDYGRLVLSHPLVVEAIETHFIPLAIFNNRGGEDAKVMRHFNEPSWNNPVVRIIDSREQQLTKRLAGDYSITGTTGAIINALEKSRSPVPEYLRIIHEENSSYMKPEKAVLSMYCFWSGEIELGKIDGVVATTAGFMHGSEVVEVQFNNAVISYSELLRKARRNGYARKTFVLTEEQEKTAVDLLGDTRIAWATTFHPDMQVKYYMSQTPYRYLPVTPMQAIRINQALYENRDPDLYLSPQQLSMLAYIEGHPNMDWKKRTDDPDFTASWNEVRREAGLGR